MVLWLSRLGVFAWRVSVKLSVSLREATDANDIGAVKTAGAVAPSGKRGDPPIQIS
jgi:hypothetical protein